MFRPLVAGLLAAGIALCAGLPGTAAQDKKDAKAQPKKKERIAVAEPKDAAKDPDFAIQGEYEGTLTINGQGQRVGVQVIANGQGEFTVKALRGGLPGAGWNGKDTETFTAKRGNNGATVTGKGTNTSGTIGDGKLEIKHNDGALTAKKVERRSKTLGERPPREAAVLFGGADDVKKWDGGKITELSDGKFLGVGETSKEKFGAFKAHVEFRLAWMPNSTGQGRSNSGVYLQNRYECQVLDSFGLKGENNECGGIYTQHKPLVNMCLPPLQWQTYDIEFTPAQFEGGKKTKNARATIYHNGVKIHDDVEFPKECPGGQKEAAEPGPFQLQNHGDPVVYRNIWVVPVK
jgi:hypothetical protein